jgi:outer membrane protein OmpA-like peptidoglycan-associated protein
MRTLIISIIILISFNSFSQNRNVFLDEFISNKNNWWVSGTTDASAKLANGKYIMEHKRNFGFYYFWKEVNFNPKEDYTIEIKVKQTKGSDKDAFGIVWGASGWDNSNSFLISSDGTFYIGGYKKKAEFTRQKYSKPGIINPKGMFNVLSIRKAGSIVKFYLNEKSVYQLGAENFFGALNGFVLGKNMELEAEYIRIEYPRPVINMVRDINAAIKKKNLGRNINSSYSEIAPIISPDGQTLYVARQNHPDNEGIAKKYDIWFATRKSDGSWSSMEKMGKPVNNDGDNLVIAVSPDGNTLLLEGLYSPNGSYISDQGISTSHRTTNGWSIPKKVVINDFYNLNEYESYCPTVDRKVMVMSVERNDTYGQKDLYVSFIQTDGSYSKPLNMGDDINTYLNEGTPFIAPDNKTLYFYSYGHAGYGSADIFVTKRLDDSWCKWSKPKNLGPTINSNDWDTYYSIAAKGDYAYLVSSRNSYGNEDVFEIKLSEESRPDPVVLVYGRVFNSKTKRPVGVDIVYEDSKSQQKIGNASSNPGNGTYKIILPYGKAYSFRAEANNYIALDEQIDLSAISTYKEIKRDLYLVPIETGSVINLQSVQFERNTAVLIESAYPELGRLIEIMKKYPKMEIELSGHTDTRGKADLLLQLSSKRVMAVKNYLIRKGISASRISGRGYGGTRPLGTGSEEIEIKNRRVEFTIKKI